MRLLLATMVAVAISATVGHAAPGDDAAVEARAAFEAYDQGWRAYDEDKVLDARESGLEVWLRDVAAARFDAYVAAPDQTLGKAEAAARLRDHMARRRTVGAP